MCVCDGRWRYKVNFTLGWVPGEARHFDHSITLLSPPPSLSLSHTHFTHTQRHINTETESSMQYTVRSMQIQPAWCSHTGSTNVVSFGCYGNLFEDNNYFCNSTWWQYWHKNGLKKSKITIFRPNSEMTMKLSCLKQNKTKQNKNSSIYTTSQKC